MKADRQPKGTVLVVEEDDTITDLVRTLLLDEGYTVSVLSTITSDALRMAVGRLEPDCILLGSIGRGNYEPAWLDAVWADGRERRVPVVMLTASTKAMREANEAETTRSRAIYAVVGKPFDIDVLLGTVAQAVGSVPRFDHSAAADRGRTAALIARLEAAGATNVRGSTQREWVSFDVDGALTLLYWSQRDGMYFVVRQAGGVMRRAGAFHDLELAIHLATSKA